MKCSHDDNIYFQRPDDESTVEINSFEQLMELLKTGTQTVTIGFIVKRDPNDWKYALGNVEDEDAD